MSELRHASDHDCAECGEQADVFWGLADPDITPVPLCDPCSDQATAKVLLELQDEGLL